MNTIKIKGKDYVTVSERLKHLAENYQYAINTDYKYFEERKMWVVKASLLIHKNGCVFEYTG
jgi:Asp-tRNA(Asn)/Glu-tRNA(Gln) amidotransferase B subunit